MVTSLGPALTATTTVCPIVTDTTITTTTTPISTVAVVTVNSITTVTSQFSLATLSFMLLIASSNGDHLHINRPEFRRYRVSF